MFIYHAFFFCVVHIISHVWKEMTFKKRLNILRAEGCLMYFSYLKKEEKICFSNHFLSVFFAKKEQCFC